MPTDPRVVLLYADALPEELHDVRRLAPDRVVNVGVAEATLVSLAAGLALAGMRPVVVGLASFLANRALAQLRQDIALNDLPVTFVGFAAGAALADMGPTHCTLDDLALMGVLPSMDLAVANDPGSAGRLLSDLLASERPGYLRIEATGSQDRNTAPYSDVQRLRDGGDATMLVHGAVTHDAILVSDEMRGIGAAVGVLSILKLRPIDLEPIRRAFRTGPVLIVEEHVPAGGLASLILRELPPRSASLAHLTPRAYSEPTSYQPSDFRVTAEEIRKALVDLLAHPTQ